RSRETMTYRRDLLDIRVVVRQSAREDTRVDPLRRHVGGDIPMRSTPDHIAIPASVPLRARALRVDAQADERQPPSAMPNGGTASPEVVLVKSGFRQVAIRVREIVFVEAARNYVRVHLESGAILKSRVPIDR